MNKLLKKLLLTMCFSLLFVIPDFTLTASDNPYSGVKGKYTDYILYGFDMVKDPLPDCTQIKKKPILDKKKLENDKADDWYDSKPGDRKFKLHTLIENSSYDLNTSIANELQVGYKTSEIGYSTNFSCTNSFEKKDNSYYGVLFSNALYEQEALSLSKYTLRNYLSEDFVEAVNAGDYNYVFKKYGTHLAEDVSIGARIYIIYNSNETCSLSKSELKSGIEANYQNLTGKTSSSCSISTSDLKKNITYSIDGNGGVANIPSDFDQNAGYNNWVNSIDNSNLAMYQVNDCIPICELFSDEATKNKLKRAYYNYFNEHLKELRDSFPFITDIRTLKDSEANVTKRTGTNEFVVGNTINNSFKYTNISASLIEANRYILYKTSTDKSKKIVSMNVQSSNDKLSQPYSGFQYLEELRPENLRRSSLTVYGLFGKTPYIYLHYNRSSSDLYTGFQALCTRQFSDDLNDNWVPILSVDGSPINITANLITVNSYLFGYVDPVLKIINKQIEENNSTVNICTNTINASSPSPTPTTKKSNGGGGGSGSGRAFLDSQQSSQFSQCAYL